jgi:hypothetical protein
MDAWLSARKAEKWHAFQASHYSPVSPSEGIIIIKIILKILIQVTI